MRINVNHPQRRNLAFTLVEAVVAMAIIAVVGIALYSGLIYATSEVRMARDDLRATQILVQKTETLRLYNWDQISSNGFIPPAFTASYAPQSAQTGVTYQGSIILTNAPMADLYSNNLKEVIITLNWTTGEVPRTRQIKTFIARHGLQTYVD